MRIVNVGPCSAEELAVESVGPLTALFATPLDENAGDDRVTALVDALEQLFTAGEVPDPVELVVEYHPGGDGVALPWLRILLAQREVPEVEEVEEVEEQDAGESDAAGAGVGDEGASATAGAGDAGAAGPPAPASESAPSGGGAAPEST